MWLDGDAILLIADAYRGLLEVANIYGPGITRCKNSGDVVN